MKQIRQRLVTNSLLLGLLITGFWLRVHRLGDRSVWWDEGWSVWLSRHSLGQILTETGHDVHPPLYFWLLHGWRLIGGDSEFNLRLLSAFLGTLTIAAVYLLGSTIGAKRTGLLAALFFTLSRFPIIWSQEIRMYALATLLGVIGAWAAIQVWDRDRPHHYLLYILAMTAGLYTLYLFFPVPLALNLAWLWVFWRSERRRQTFLNWGSAQIVVLALLIPWLSFALKGFLTTSSATPISLVDFLKIYWTVLVLGIPLNVESYARFTLPVLVVFLGAVVALLWQARRAWRPARHITFLLIVLLIPLGIVFYVTIPKSGAYAPPFSPRYLVIFSGFFSITLAWGILQAAGRRWLLSLIMSGVVIYAAWIGLRSYHSGRVLHDDYNSLVATIEAYKRPSDAVILFTDTDWPIFAYHHPEEWRGVPHAWQITPQVADEYLSPIWAASDGLWLVMTPYAGVSDPQGAMVKWLADRAAAVAIYSYDDKALQFYARTNARASLVYELAASETPRWSQTAVIGAGWQLSGYDQDVRDAKSGDIVHLFIYGFGLAAETQVGLVDSEGQVWQETAVALPAASTLSRQQIDLLISPDTPSGAYHFFVWDEGGKIAELGGINLRQKQDIVLTTADVTIANRLETDFEGGIRLLGYEVETEAPQPGGTVYLTLYWQAQGSITQKYKVFTHLLGEVYNADGANFLWGQQDNEPVNNTRPTTTWRNGEVIVDSYAIPIQGNAPAGSYQIEIGLYDPVTGIRLPLLTGADNLILGEVAIGN